MYYETVNEKWMYYETVNEGVHVLWNCKWKSACTMKL